MDHEESPLIISQNLVTFHENETENDYFTNLIISDLCEIKELNILKICLVCGDKALGYNFGALSCESCKAFFRRNANKKSIPSCVFNEKCEITVNTRRFCTYCRLMKCFKMKMKKENIINHSNKNRNSKGHEKPIDKYFNSIELMDKSNSVSPDSCSLTTSDEKTSDVSSDKNDQINLKKEYNYATQIQTIKKDFSNSVSSHSGNCLISENGPFRPTIIMSISKKSKLISINDKLSREGLARLLNEEEWDTLFYIHKSYIDNFFESGSMSPSAIENANLINLINSSGFLVRKLINFAKCLSDFTSLEQSCQIALLKGAVLNSLILRSAVEYNVDKNVWITPEGEISSDIIKTAGLYELQEDYARYCRSFKKLLGSDEYLISITQILCLFSSDNFSLTDRQFVSDIHDKYLVLLKHYLESLYGFVDSRSIFVLVVSHLIDLQCLTSKHGQILLHIDPTNIDPLMLEVFNMNLSNINKN